MLRIFQTKNPHIIRSVFNFEPDLEHEFIIINKDTKIIGMFEIQPVTKITGILHLHIKQEYQNQGIASEAMKKLVASLKQTNYKSLVALIPASNKNIMSIVNKTKAKCCGLLQDGIILNNVVQDLIIFQLMV